MKQPNLLAKVAVVASSVLLASGGVGLYAGAFDGLLGLNVRTADSGTMSSSKLKVLGVTAAPENSDAQGHEQVQQSPPKTSERHRVLMSDSKHQSGNILDTFNPDAFKGSTSAKEQGASSESSRPSP